MARIKAGSQVILFNDPRLVHRVAWARRDGFATTCGEVRSLTRLSRIGNTGTTTCPTCLWCMVRL